LYFWQDELDLQNVATSLKITEMSHFNENHVKGR
jgi:hypothetical protein